MEQDIDFEIFTHVAEVEIVYKSKVKPSNRPVVKSSKDAWAILRRKWDEGKMELMEQFKMILLNRAGRVLGIINLCDGTMDNASVDRRLVFATALKMAATSIIVCHNHPSGSVQPSKADEIVTQVLREAGKILGITLQDHIIITADGYFSFADQGLLGLNSN